MSDITTGDHVRLVQFQHTPVNAASCRPRGDAEERDRARERIWELAALIVERCPKVRSFTWELGIGVGGRLWKVSAVNWTSGEMREGVRAD
jgi:hypothetical protein